MIVGLLVVCGVLPALFLVALRAKWFSRLSRGFEIAVILAITGFALIGAALSGVLTYQAGRQIVLDEIVSGLSSTGDVIEANLRQMIRYQIDQLHQYASFAAPELPAKATKQLTTELLRMMDKLNQEITQIDAYDAKGNALASSHVQREADPVSHVAVATALDGSDFVSDAQLSPTSKTYVLIIATPIRDPSNAVIGALTIRYDLEGELSMLIRSTRFRGNGFAAIASSSGRWLAHVDPKRINVDVSGSAWFQNARHSAGWLVDKDYQGKARLWVYRPIQSPASGSPMPWSLAVQMDEMEALAPIDQLRNQALLALAILAVPCLLVGWRTGVSILHPVGILGGFVRKVEGGDFSGKVPESRDEVGRLGQALNRMTRGLVERDRVKELFGRYVATQVSEEILKGEVSMGGESRLVSILFSDIRGFTAMSEQMTPAQVVSFLNDYFSEMVEAVFEQGGVLDKFMGDGLMAVFGSIDDMPDHPRRAVLAALRMKSLLSKINGDRGIQGKPPIHIGIGVHTAEVIVGNIGSRRRLEYTVIGDGVNTCSRVQALNKEYDTTILITESTRAAVKDEFECRLMPEREIRGKIQAIRFYEVVSVKADGGGHKPRIAVQTEAMNRDVADPGIGAKME